jgi:hypothetical protein
MAEQRKRLSELPTATSTDGLYTLGVDESNEGVKIDLGDYLESVKKPATEAKTAANDAVTTANNAYATAKQAASDANSALDTAKTAVSTAKSAYDTATAASSTAATATSTANDALTLAQSTADDVQEAIDTANAANDTAQTAVDNAENAQTTANDAVTTANATNELIKPRLFVNASVLLGLTDSTTLETVIGAISQLSDYALYRQTGIVLTFCGESGWESWQYIWQMRSGIALPTFDPFTRATYWKKFGGSAAVGNIYNVTVDVPKTGYYDLASAIAVAYDNGYNNIGVQITFAIADKSWKTYQFVGASSDETAFKNENNWIDLAGMSAGSETLINIDALCGPCVNATYYTLEYAISALTALSASTGIDYKKSGLVITYQTGENAFETRQFQSTVGNFGEASLWVPFGGGGGSSVATSDDPESGGTDALSTGGAYRHIPTKIIVDTETEGTVKLSLANDANEVVGDEAQFAVGTGSGGGSGVVMEITPKESPLYGQAGGTIEFQCAITLKNGSDYETGIIEKVELYDRDTNTLLETYKLNQRTSDDKTSTDDFTFDVSRYFTLASSRKFRFIAYDDADRTASRNVNVTAVDVTIKSEQTLNYTASTVLTEGATTAKMLPMYRFANNASDKGILCTVEIYIDGEWRVLGTANINDTYAHQVSINPANCCGYVLKHGAYPLRIHGEDVSSGVVGNYLHTAVMVVNTDNSTPIVVSRWYTETAAGTVRQLESINVDFAAYCPTASTVNVNVIQRVDGVDTVKQTTPCARSSYYTYSQRITGFETDGSQTIEIRVESVDSPAVVSETAAFNINGSLLNIESVSAQLMYDMDMSSRSNSDADKTVKDGGYELALTGANYTTNGFVKDSFGTASYGTESDTGIMAMRIAENVTGVLNDAMFNVAAIETNGLAIQFRIRVKHIADDDARLISCIANGIGFYVTGKYVVFTTDNGETVQHTIKSALTEDTLTDVAIVIEPTSIAPYTGIGVVKMYFDGELIGTSYYESGSLSRHNTPITFDGTSGDLYLYNIRKWETYYTFEQSFNNYLLKLADTDTMISEYQFNTVMSSQSAEGKPAKNIPQMSALLEKGVSCMVMCKSAATDDVADNYPEYLEGLDGDKKTPRNLDWYFYFAGAEYRNIVIENSPTTNQGTTSSWRPVKNKKSKVKKASKIRMMYERDYVLANYPDHIDEYDYLAGLCEKKKIQLIAGTLATNIFTIKVDYSESGGANNGASTELYNALTRALGANYMTPAQNAYTGDADMNPCIASVPCALFRTDINSTDATSPTNAYFHAKANLNHDKGDAAIFGFENAPGYNDGCLNYGDFYELITARDQSVDDFVAAADKSTWEYAVDSEDATKGNWNVIVISEFCGANHRVFRRNDNTSEWTETTGTMQFTGGRWRITGDVVNPVECYELKAYNAMDWFQGVSTVDDMIQLDESGKPLWLTYFESRYPDDDTLNAAYEDGRKLPYRLFAWLQWCNDCNQNKTSSDGKITVDGKSVSGTKANRLLKFKHELHNVANVYSMICYHVFTDYLAAVDQRSKNMMLGFYLDTDGTVRAYMNHLYDGDTILGSDNDCGLTIPAELDPNNDPNGYYQGHDSVLFTQLAASDYIWLTDYTADTDTADSTKTTTVASIASAMRSVEIESSGLRPFSKQGIEKYWITDRLSKYPKLVSSYDGIRKYIDASKSSANYFYALHGLSIQRLRDFVETRFLYRDGFYKCGDTFATAAQMRCTGTDMTVTITAAKDGFFGLGVDRANEARDSQYLKAGESYTFKSGNTNTGSGVMLYLFGADRIGELDLRNATPKQQGWDISAMTLLRRLIIGGEDYTPATAIGDELATLNLGQMPFLNELDVRNFPIASINAEYCPRLTTVRATGSRLTTFTPAQTSPLSTLELPDTMTALTFINLPKLTYGTTSSDGLSIAGFANVKRLQIAQCAGINAVSLLTNVVNGGAPLTEISITDIDVNASDAILTRLRTLGVKGIGSDVDNGCDGITGTWILTNMVEDDMLTELQSYFKPSDVGLTVHNAQFTGIVFDDSVDDPKNITNLDNGTTGSDYVASGHISRIRSLLVPVKGKLNTDTGVWEGERLSDTNYHNLYDETEFDYTDKLDAGFDVFMRCPAFWYKGVNDFKNQKKYMFWSSVENTPISTAKNVRRSKLSDIIAFATSTIQTLDINEGVDTLDTDGVIASTPNYNVYRFDVTDMKQVRFPGINSSSIGAVFVDAAGTIIQKVNLAVATTDFIEGEYVFYDVPENAVAVLFSSRNTNNTLEAIAVDSSNIEAIEPDWVHNDAWLGGVYQMSVDSLMRLRSISGATVRCGSGTHTTSSEWVYDANGRVRNTPVNGLNYTNKDRQNLAMLRGNGYQLFDYEMSKLMALLWMSLSGTRDAQLVCGYGKSAGGTTGYMDTIGNADSQRSSTSNTGNKCLGFESFFGCTWEVMDNVAVNVVSWESYLKNYGVENSSDPIDAKWHIYDPITKTERVVQGITSSGVCIARTKHGRYCDVIASKCSTDSSKYALNYCDVQYYSGSRCRVVGRSNYNAYANGGLVYASANSASSSAYTDNAARLAFRGTISVPGLKN